MKLFILLLLQCGSLVTAILNPIDFLALQSIRKALHDMPGSNYLSSWDFSSDPCNFAGVGCEGDNIVALNLGDPRATSPGLSGRIDTAIGDLSALEEFTIVPGQVFGSLPPSISSLKNLRFLGISRNFISGEIPDSLWQLKDLQTLDLSYNQLIGNIPPAIGALQVLSNAILSHNRLFGSIPNFSSQTLTRLDLSHNELSGPLPSDSLPPSLQYLSLSSNRVDGPVNTLLTQLTRLNYIDLSLNRFTGCIPPILFTFPITTLRLQRNLFAGRVEPASEVQISTVDLSFNRLYGEISPMLSTVENLYLNNNRFTGEVPGIFVERILAANIMALYLQHNFLSGMEIDPATEIPVRSSLCLQYNCMVPPIDTHSCPFKAGRDKTRPIWQCKNWRG